MKKIYLAPMEGVTTSIYRRCFAKYYTGIDKFYTPFLSPNQTKSFQMKELEEIDVEKNAGMNTVPQVLCNNSEHFIWAARVIADKGYKEINLNLGCPSNTVVAKKKGSGFLFYPEELDRFLYDIFEGTKDLGINVSVKTRLGKNDPSEFEALMDIYNNYPIYELTLHPRIQKEFYKGTVHLDWMDFAYKNSKNPLCANGDIFTTEKIKEMSEKYPEVTALMLGRGLIARPYLLEEGDKIKDKRKFLDFHSELLEAYCERISGDFSILCKLKELWFYMLPAFEQEDEYAKKMRKVTRVTEYRSLVQEIVDSVR